MSDLERRLATLSPKQRAALETLLARDKRPGPSGIPPRSADDGSPLSFAEHRLWLVDRIEPDHPFYNMPLAAELRGDLCLESLQEALKRVAERHETLRTTFPLEGDSPVRVVNPSATDWPLELVDASQWTKHELTKRLREDARRPFDIEAGPLMRCHVYRCGEQRHLVLLVTHHIISDGWSTSVLLREWSVCYEAARRGRPAQLPELQTNYSDFAVWQRKQLSGDRLQRELSYWQRQLEGAAAVTQLPLDHPRPTIQDFDGARASVVVDDRLAEAVRRTARRMRTTDFVVMLAAYAALLSKWCGQDDLCIGTVVANRREPSLEQLIGFFVNTLVVRCQVAGELPFDTFVKNVRETLNAGLAHQDLPFERLVESLAPGRDRSHSPLFQTAMVVQDMPELPQQSGELEVQPLDLDHGTAKHDLTFLLFPHGDGYRGHVEYRRRLFEPATVDRIIRAWLHLLGAACQAGDCAIGELPSMHPDDAQLLRRWSAGADYTDKAPVKNLPEEVDRHADRKAPALEYDGVATTHGQFREGSLRIASGLRRMGVGRGDRVVVRLPRSADLLSTMFGVWRAGAVYVPVDPEMPAARRAEIEADCDPAAIVVETLADADDTQPESLVSVSGLLETLDSEVELEIEHDVAAEDLAYIIYTSGSSGRPKGVEVEHGSIVRFLRGQAAKMSVDAQSRVLHSLSPSFDGGLSESLLGLSQGGCSVVATTEEAADPELLTSLLNRGRVNVAKFPPAKLALLEPADILGLAVVSTGGDTLTGDLARRWLEAGRRVLNGYGPTEVTVGCAMCELTLPVDPRPPIGSPLQGQQVYVVDAEQRPAPMGVAGEIWVGGPGVARGYRGLPELTAERFVRAPWDGERVYRTGDQGRWRWDGELEFLGRIDDQVKIRGYRVEPDEVAAVLNACDGVRQAVVVAADEPGGTGKQLVAYAEPTREELSKSDDAVAQVDAWEQLFDQTHRAAPVALDPEFNIAGWVDSFTGGGIPADEMRQWADNAAGRILALQPRRVLEVGCGTGLIVHRVAPHVEEFVGVDFLESSLRQLQAVLDKRDDREHVRLLRRRADQLQDLPCRHFDTVVLNSVIQYFPSEQYLRSVLEAIEPLIAEGGTLFIGDVRNFDLQPALAAAIELARAADDAPAKSLRTATYSRLAHEEELLVAPGWFDRAAEQFQRKTLVDVWLKEDSGDNELARFRYDVLMRWDRDDASRHSSPAVEVDGTQSPWNDPAGAVRQWSRTEGVVRIGQLKNRRVSADQWLWQRLRDGADSLGNMTAGELRGAAERQRQGGDPAVFAAQLREHAATQGVSAKVTLHWGAAPDEFVAAMARQHGPERGETAPPVRLPAGPVEAADVGELCNQPLRDKVAARMTPLWMKQLRDRLPEFMLPSSIVVMPELPRTLQGKVDRRRLPPPPAGRPAWAEDVVAPETDDERMLVEVWESLLGVQPISVHDNFFEVGGHSLLAVRVMSEITRRSGKRLPLAALFHEPTPRRLAQSLDRPESALLQSLVPLKPMKEPQAAALPPLFCVHPAGGTVFCYRELAAALPAERPVFGLQAVGVDGHRPPHETMEEMAEHYARVIRGQLGAGALCHLCGWSLGGNVAYEVARRLASGGVRVGLVTLFDAGAVPSQENLDEQDFLAMIVALFPGEDHLPLEELRSLPPVEQIEYFGDRARRAGLLPPDDPHGGRLVYEVFQKNIKVVHQHQTLPYSGIVHLFRPQDQQRTGELFDDPCLGWQGLTQVEWSFSPGDHAHMVQAPHAASVALRLESLMRQHDDGT